jgi:putative ABC transport system permease protein
MRKVTISGLFARKLRLALTALAIVLGVTFVTGTLILGDTLNHTFNALIGTAYRHVSFEIRGKAVLNDNSAVDSIADRKPIPQSIATVVGRLPGVADVSGSVGGYAQFMARDGDAIGGGGSSTLGFSFDPNRRLSDRRR